MNTQSLRLFFITTTALVLFIGLVVAYAKDNAREPLNITKPQPQGQTSAPAAIKYFNTWGIYCNSQQANIYVCTLAQELRRKEDNARLTLMEVRPTSLSQASVSLTLPFGLAVKSGVTLQVDNGPMVHNVAYSTCYQQGCIVPMKLDRNALNAIRHGKHLKVNASIINEGSVNFELPLEGFEAAYATVIKLESVLNEK